MIDHRSCFLAIVPHYFSFRQLVESNGPERRDTRVIPRFIRINRGTKHRRAEFRKGTRALDRQRGTKPKKITIHTFARFVVFHRVVVSLLSTLVLFRDRTSLSRLANDRVNKGNNFRPGILSRRIKQYLRASTRIILERCVTLFS